MAALGLPRYADVRQGAGDIVSQTIITMKTNSPLSVPPSPDFTEDDIRDYAYHLYQQSGCVPGRDLDNWLEAKACLEANIPKQHSHARLHRHRHPDSSDTFGVVTIETQAGLLFDPLRPEPTRLEIERVLLLSTP